MTVYRALAELEDHGGGGALCTIISSTGSTPRHVGSKMLVYPDGHFTGTVGGGEMESRVIHEAVEAYDEGRPRTVSYSLIDPKQGDPGICGGTVEVFIEPILGKPLLLIVGGGHVGKAVSHLGKWLGFRVAVSDDRPEFSNKEANPDADEFYPVALKDLPSSVSITPNTYIVLTTRGMPIDVPGLPGLLATPAAYIGVIGSKRRWLSTRSALVEMGIPNEQLEKVFSPIGIELKAETPEEIAVSIMAEILMLRNGASGLQMRYQG
jgi:xanthine dehydrogenase accessory factor